MTPDERRQAYYCGREWGLKREAVHRRADSICERCRKNPGAAVHHKTYANLYREPLTDLILLCEECHDFTHGRSDVDPAKQKMRVYMAGAVFDTQCANCERPKSDYEACEADCGFYEKVASWREEVFARDRAREQSEDMTNYGSIRWKNYEFIYAGPTIILCHGHFGGEGLPTDCLKQVRGSDALFAWIDRDDTIGTLVEIGAAVAYRKKTFVAFASEQLQSHFYFVDRLGPSVVAASAEKAWQMFLATLRVV